MSNWEILIESAPGLTDDLDDLERFDARMREHGITVGLSATMNTAAKTLSARFDIEAKDPREAVAIGIPAFLEALSAAGFKEGKAAKVSVEPAVEERELVPA